MSGIGLILNASSRHRVTPALLRALHGEMAGAGTLFGTASLAELQRAAERCHRQGIDCLAIVGGDGTIHHTLSTFLRVYGPGHLPPVAILRGGTMNTVSTSWGLRSGPRDLLRRLVRVYRRGQGLPTFTHQVLQVGPRYGFIFGTGVVHSFLDAYYKTGRPSPRTAAVLLARCVGSGIVRGPLARTVGARFTARVTVDGELWPTRDFLAITAGTVQEIGLGFRPHHRCYERPGHIAVLGIHGPGLGLAADLPRIRAGVGMRQHRCIEVVARHTVVESDRSLCYVIDGDLYEEPSGALVLSTGPKLHFVDFLGAGPA